MSKKESRIAAANTKKSHSNNSNKLRVCLDHHLFRLGNAGTNTLEAKTLYDDTCLHNTISQINQVFKIRPDRHYETLINHEGLYTRYMRYWLHEEQRETVAKLLGFGVVGGAAL